MNLKKILAGAGATALLLSNVAMPAFAAPLTNGGFELADINGNYVTLNAGDGGLNGWTIVSGSVDHIDDYWQPAEGDQSIDLSGNSAATINQTFDTVAGTEYKVSFKMSGNPDGGADTKTVHVTATGGAETPFSFNTGANSHGNMMWELKEYMFTATQASTTLTFASQEEGFFGPAIDDVKVEVVSPSITPTPGPTIPEECDETLDYNVIEGTSGSDVLNGTSGPDMIYAGAGSDMVNGKGGADCIMGEAGSDLLIAGAGADVVLGGDESDSIMGDLGADKLYGGPGSDALNGGDNNDHLWGNAGSDSLKGGNGADHLDGGDGSDAANGNAGSDTCDAEAESSCEA